MREVSDLLRAFGWALLKLLIGLTVGLGVGLVTVGGRSLNDPGAWDFRTGPPIGEVMLAIGIGLLASAVMFIVLFYSPWSQGSPGRGKRRDDGSLREER